MRKRTSCWRHNFKNSLKSGGSCSGAIHGLSQKFQCGESLGSRSSEPECCVTGRFRQGCDRQHGTIHAIRLVVFCHRLLLQIRTIVAYHCGRPSQRRPSPSSLPHRRYRQCYAPGQPAITQRNRVNTHDSRQPCASRVCSHADMRGALAILRVSRLFPEARMTYGEPNVRFLDPSYS